MWFVRNKGWIGVSPPCLKGGGFSPQAKRRGDTENRTNSREGTEALPYDVTVSRIGFVGATIGHPPKQTAKQEGTREGAFLFLYSHLVIAKGVLMALSTDSAISSKWEETERGR